MDAELAFYRKRAQERPTSWSDQNFFAGALLAKAQAEDNDALFAEATRVTQKSLKLNSDHNKEAHLLEARISEGHHNFKHSYEIIKGIYDADPGNPGMQSMISNSLLEMGRVNEAWTWMQPSLKEAHSGGMLVQAARICTFRGQDDQAVQLLAEALKIEQPQERKTSARIRSLWGELELRHGRLESARELLRTSLDIQKRSLPALLAMSRLERREGKPQEALTLLTAAYSYFHNPAILTEMGAMQAKLGHPQEADKLRKQAESILQKEVGTGMIGHARDLAKAQLDQGKAAQALAVLREENKYRSDHRNWELQAMCLEALKQPKEALAAMEKAMADGYQDPAFYARAARLAKELNDPRASEWEAKQKQLDPGFSLDQ